jgi:hypothetical protein
MGIPFGPGAPVRPVPGGRPGDPQATIVGSRVIAIRHRVLAGLQDPNVQVSNKLPVPCVISFMTWFQSAVSTQTVPGAADVYVANNDDLTYNPATLGLRLTDHRLAGASPPDLLTDSQLTLVAHDLDTHLHVPLWHPVSASPSYIKTVAQREQAFDIAFWFYFTILILDRPWTQPGLDILPRGVEEDPVCVRICEPIPGFPPTPIPPGPPPPPPGPPVPEGFPEDPFAEPLPGPCPVDPEFPMASLADACDVTEEGP